MWTSQSDNSAGSMPCGGGDIGLNVWVEKGDLLFYISRSGTFDENNTLLKQGRVRLKLSPNPFDADADFKQELILKEGYVQISGKKGNLETTLKVWVDVFKPVVHLDIKSNQKTIAEAAYESWRFEDRLTKGKENNQNSYKWAPRGEMKTFKDSIAFKQHEVVFYHENKEESVFDVTVKQQGLGANKAKLYNPLKNLVFGGSMKGTDMQVSGNDTGTYLGTAYKAWKLKSNRALKSMDITITLHTARTTTVDEWEVGLKKTATSLNLAKAFNATKNWWKGYWERSFIDVSSQTEPLAAQVARNYTLFRYMLGCNAYGAYPTKFNGGLFTYDPAQVDTALKFTPDFRNWGGGTHTAQNQRLVYWPMLKSGDADLMKPQFDFYKDLVRNAELRSEFYWVGVRETFDALGIRSRPILDVSALGGLETQLLICRITS